MRDAQINSLFILTLSASPGNNFSTCFQRGIMDRPQIHWFYKRIKADQIQKQFYFELGGGLAFLLRRFHMIQPEYKAMSGIGTSLFPWQLKTTGFLPAGPQIVAFAENAGKYFISGNSANGVWRSDDNGGTWQQKNTGGIMQSYQLLQAAAYLMNIGPAGIRSSINNGDTWQTLFDPPDLSEPRAIAYDGVQLYLGTTTTVYWSSDFTGGWTPPITPPGAFITGLIQDPAALGTVYASSFTGGMFKTTDGGQNWAAINTGLASVDCQCVDIKDGVLYCGTNTTGAYKSTDGGATWNAINTGFLVSNITSIKAKTALIVIAGTQAGGVYITIDGGTTWTPQNTGLSGFGADQTKAWFGTHIFSGTTDGFFITDFVNNISYPKIGVEFIDGTGAIRWQLDPIPAELYSAPRYNGVTTKIETAPADDKGYGVNLSAVFKPRSNTVNLFYDLGELITCKLTGFEFLTPPGAWCPDYVDIAVEGVYIPNMPSGERVL